MTDHFDLVVLGSGPAGEKGAAQAAQLGKRVALVERAPHLGGAGLNTGTLPSKTLRETALYYAGFRQRGLYGIDYSLREGLTIGDFMYRRQQVTENEWELLRNRLEEQQIEVVWGSGHLVEAHTVGVTLRGGGQRTLTADYILLATGSRPYRPPEIPFDHPGLYDSESILHMQRIPHNLVVVGGGPIGTEYASIFTALGVSVTLIDERDRLLDFIDSEIVDHLRQHLQLQGLRLISNARINQVTTPTLQSTRLTLRSGETLDAEAVLFTTGRTSNVGGLGLEQLGIGLTDQGLIRVNEYYQTSRPHIYAAGDVVGFPARASTSMEQARRAVRHAFNHLPLPAASAIPLAVYTIPEIALVGLTEDDCRARQIPYLVGRAYYQHNARGQIIGDTSGLVKLIFAPADRRLLGVSMLGEQAAELIHLGSHVLASQGTIDAFSQAVYNYPSLSEAYKYAAHDGLAAWERTRRSPGGID